MREHQSITVTLSSHKVGDRVYIKAVYGGVMDGRYGSFTVAILETEELRLPQDPEELLSMALDRAHAAIYHR